MTVRGWCPSVHEPMRSGDGLLARVKPFGGRLPANALRAIADAVEAYGNGIIELTSRGNLQVRGLHEASAPGFASAMVTAGLADPDPARERRRNIIVMPPYDDALAAEVEAILSSIGGLPAKFCVAIGQADANIMIVSGIMTAQDLIVPYSPDALRCMALHAAGHLPLASTQTVPGSGLLFLRYGQTDSAGLRALAAATDDARTTPYRAFHVPESCRVAGFIADPADISLSIAACPGAPACASGTTATRSDADRLAARGIGNLHISGCAKGCAKRQAGRTLVGSGGRYDLIDYGRAGDAPRLTGLTIDQAAALL